MSRRRRNCRRDSYSSEMSDIDNMSILEIMNTCSSTGKQTNSKSRKRGGTVIKSTTSKIPRDINNTIIVLDDSDEDCLSTVISRSRAINDHVKNTVDDIFKTSGLISDDEDEPLLIHSNTINIPKGMKNTPSISVNEPSSSTCGARVLDASISAKHIVAEDQSNEINTMEDIQNYCKETEDMLKNANAILEKFAGTSSPVEEQPTKIKTPKDKENGTEEKKLECPICYESLSGKPVMTTKCGHLFCKTCIERVARSIKKCPTCRKAVNKKNIIPIYI